MTEVWVRAAIPTVTRDGYVSERQHPEPKMASLPKAPLCGWRDTPPGVSSLCPIKSTSSVLTLLSQPGRSFPLQAGCLYTDTTHSW